MIKTNTTPSSHSSNQVKTVAPTVTRVTNTSSSSVEKVATQFMNLFSEDHPPLLISHAQLTLAINYAKLLYESAMKKTISTDLPTITTEKTLAKTPGYQSTSVSLLFSPCQQHKADKQRNDYALYALSNLAGIKLPKR